MKINFLKILLTILVFSSLVLLSTDTISAECLRPVFCAAAPGTCDSQCYWDYYGGPLGACEVGGHFTRSVCPGACPSNPTFIPPSNFQCNPTPVSCATYECSPCALCENVTWETCCTPGTPPPTGSPVPSSPSPSPIEPSPPPVGSPGPSPSAPPTTPTGVTCSTISSSRINVAWNASSGATGYNVLRCTGAGCTPTSVVQSQAGTSWSNTGLGAATTYRYRVIATGPGGNSGFSSTVTCATLPVPPTTPTNLTCSSTGSTQINLNWTATAGTTNYDIFRCTGTGCTPSTPAISSPTTNTFNNTGLTAGTTYRYRITARNTGGSSPYSTIVTCAPCETGAWETFSCGPPFCDVDERVESRSSSGSCAPSVELERCVQDDLCMAESWYQVQGGNIYAARTDSPAIRSIISATDCTEPACIPNLITMMQELLNVDTDGVIISGGGSIETAGHYTPRDLVAQNTRLTRFKEGYDFFYRRSELGSSPTDSFATQHNGALKPGTEGVHYSAQDLVIQDPWSVSAAESYVVFVDGNLTIENPSDFATLIEVEEGGFLAFIVRGNITFAANVGHTNLATQTPNIEGIYIAENQIIVRTNEDPAVGDRRFIGAGSFVGWSGVDLQRDFADFGSGGSGATFNLTIPTETFIYRPDMVLSTPDFMLSPRSIWQETN